MTVKSYLVRAMPRPLEHVLRRLLGRPARVPNAQGEKSAEWYDRAFEEAEDYSVHYTESTYYPSWTVIMDRVRHARSRSVLEVACGPGQLACALRESRLLDAYVGFDFAEKRIEAARRLCPDIRFEVADAFTTPLFDEVPYDTVISTEFLEHVNDDIGVIARIRAGARLIGTVPNYPYVSHVRHFSSAEEVLARYGDFFDDLTVFPVVRNRAGKTLFIVDGVKRERAV